MLQRYPVEREAGVCNLSWIRSQCPAERMCAEAHVHAHTHVSPQMHRNIHLHAHRCTCIRGST